MARSRSSQMLTLILALLGGLCLTFGVMAEGDLFGNDARLTSLSLSETWHCLGPFRTGTREAIWGADPLERHGGFSNIVKDETTTFRSALTTNATVHWTSYKAKVEHDSRSAVAYFELTHLDVDWMSLQKVYGWSALQYQTWLRGEISNRDPRPRKVLIYPEGILEFYIDDIPVFGGDFYSLNKAPVVVTIKPGRSAVNLRLIRDVRSMGGGIPPYINVQFRLLVVEEPVYVDLAHVVVPDIVDGRLPSHYMSIPVLNNYHEWVTVHSCPALATKSDASLIDHHPIKIAPGQTRPISLLIGDHISGANIDVQLCYDIGCTGGSPQDDLADQQLKVSIQLIKRNIDEGHKFTFIHPSKGVSYAILKPPRYTSTQAQAPLLVNLHGSGLEADSEGVRHMLDDMPHLDTFALFPTGMTPWCGDDWHVWGTADVLAAINAVHDWTDQMQWNGTKVTTDRVLVSGHSNGGQGTWFFTSHLPDRTLAAVPASGFSSVETYIPFSLWHEADPLQDSILYTARRDFRHELFIENLEHLPLLQQHGSADDNVPPYHSRLMSSLRFDLGADSSYVELPGKGHWWLGAMTTTSLQDFYTQHLFKENEQIYAPNQFSLISSATDEMGYKFGIAVYLLESPDRLARVDVQVIREAVITWQISTANVRALQFNIASAPVERPDILYLVDSQQSFDVDDLSTSQMLVRNHGATWGIEDSKKWSQETRTGSARGTLDAIMRTTGPFQIVSCLDDLRLALQISRNMLQYFGADSEISHYEGLAEPLLHSGNFIKISQGPNVPLNDASSNDYPISFNSQGVSLKLSDGGHYVIPFEKGMGAAFIRPVRAEQLELVVWGYDAEGLEQAARLVPTLSGGGQPDFVILARKSKWQGHAGTLAMGFFDYSWNISKSSYLP